MKVDDFTTNKTTNVYSTWNIKEDLFACHTKNPPRECAGLDDCINHSFESECFSIHKLIRGHQSPMKRAKKAHLKPVAHVKFNNRLGKPSLLKSVPYWTVEALEP